MFINKNSSHFLTLLALLLFVFCYLAWFPHHAFGQSSIGIGVAEPIVKPNSSFFGQIFLTIQFWQKKFERLVSTWLISMHDNPWQALKLLGISFLYGILHASGPGHGKAVISSYLLAKRETIKRGIFLSFWSSFLQALSAIAIVGAVYYFLPARLTQTTDIMVKLSFGLIIFLGLWLLYQKTKPFMQAIFYKYKKNKKYEQLFDENLDWKIKTKDKNNQKTDIRNDHVFFGSGQNCNICGSTHIFAADMITKPIQWKQVLIAVFSVGLRPCTGAIFIMSYTMLNNLFWIGSLAVLFMAFGTFITVAVLASFAVRAKDLLRNWQNGPIRGRILPILEWCLALFIFLFGLTFFIV